MTITAKQNADGTILLTGAVAVTVTETAGGLAVSADSAIPLLDQSAPLQAKLSTAKADIAALSAALAKLTSDLA